MSDVLDPHRAATAELDTAPVPEALRPPAAPVSLRFQLLLGLAGVGIWLTGDPVVTLLIPTQVTKLTPNNAATGLAVVTTVGAVVALLVNVVIGALSDRTTSSLGRRRPWIMGGMLVSAIALTLLARAPSIAVLTLAWGLAQAGSNTMICTTAAAIPDRVPDRQRGVASAIYGLAVPVALFVGSILLGSVIAGVAAGYYALVLLMLAAVTPFVLTQRDPALPSGALAPVTIRGFIAGFWISPRRHRDFALAWITRFLVILGYVLGVGSFLFLYVQKVLRYEVRFPGHQTKEGVATLLVIAIVAELPAALGAAVLSDRLQRRKVFVIVSSLVITVALALIAVFHSWTVARVAALLMGLGFGSYIAVDSALITQVLPSASSRARDLGIMSISNLVPGTVGPLVGAGLINAFGQDSATGYTVLFGVAAGLTLLSAMLVQRIQSVA